MWYFVTGKFKDLCGTLSQTHRGKFKDLCDTLSQVNLRICVVFLSQAHVGKYKECMVAKKDALNTYYGYINIRHMVKDHVDGEIGNPLLPLHGLHFLINKKGPFINTIPYTG